MNGREGIYRVFMSAYGLLFPAILLVALLTRRNDRAVWIASLVIVLIAAPMYTLGFIVGRDHWLGIGFGAVVLGSLATIVLRRQGPFTSPEPDPTRGPGHA